MSFPLDCSSYFLSMAKVTSFYGQVASSETVTRVKEAALKVFSNFYQVCTKAEAHTNDMNVKTGAWLGCMTLIIIIAAAIIRARRQNRNQPLV